MDCHLDLQQLHRSSVYRTQCIVVGFGRQYTSLQLLRLMCRSDCKAKSFARLPRRLTTLQIRRLKLCMKPFVSQPRAVCKKLSAQPYIETLFLLTTVN